MFNRVHMALTSLIFPCLPEFISMLACQLTPAGCRVTSSLLSRRWRVECLDMHHVLELTEHHLRCHDSLRSGTMGVRFCRVSDFLQAIFKANHQYVVFAHEDCIHCAIFNVIGAKVLALVPPSSGLGYLEQCVLPEWSRDCVAT